MLSDPFPEPSGPGPVGNVVFSSRIISLMFPTGFRSHNKVDPNTCWLRGSIPLQMPRQFIGLATHTCYWKYCRTIQCQFPSFVLLNDIRCPGHYNMIDQRGVECECMLFGTIDLRKKARNEKRTVLADSTVRPNCFCSRYHARESKVCTLLKTYNTLDFKWSVIP